MFIQSQINPCLFTKGSVVMVLYVDNVIIIIKYAIDIQNLLMSLKEETDVDTGKPKANLKKFSFTDDGAIKTFLEINIEKIKNGYHLS